MPADGVPPVPAWRNVATGIFWAGFDPLREPMECKIRASASEHGGLQCTKGLGRLSVIYFGALYTFLNKDNDSMTDAVKEDFARCMCCFLWLNDYWLIPLSVKLCKKMTCQITCDEMVSYATYCTYCKFVKLQVNLGLTQSIYRWYLVVMLEYRGFCCNTLQVLAHYALGILQTRYSKPLCEHILRTYFAKLIWIYPASIWGVFGADCHKDNLGRGLLTKTGFS